MLYLIGGLLAAVLVAGGFAGCEHRRADANAAEREQVRAEFAGFKLEAERIGKEQEQAAKDKEASDRVIHDKTVAALQHDLAGRDAALKRLRDAPISRPDRSPVPVTSCGPKGADGATGQFISAVEYRELQSRAYDDALRLTRLQEWVKATGHPVE